MTAGLPPPRENAGLLGQETAERTLLEGFNSGRLAHAWLICGPRGIGKATLAYRFARFVLAEGGMGGGGTGGGLFGAPESLALPADHPTFRRVASGGHPDLLVLERAFDEKRNRQRSEIVVDDVRQVGAFLSLTAAESAWRVVVVDSADEMNRNAANALLKVLEEPPKRALLLLVAHAPGRLLPTIRSRCRRLNLGPLAPEVMERLLAQGQPDLPVEERQALVRLGEGSIGHALRLAEQGGLVLYREMLELIQTMPAVDVPTLHALAERLARPQAEDAYRTLADLTVWWLARLIRLNSGAPTPEVMAAEAELMHRLAGGRRLDPWIDVWENTTELLARADSLNLDRKQVLLKIFLGIAAASRP